MMKKNILSVLLILVFWLAGCGGNIPAAIVQSEEHPVKPEETGGAVSRNNNATGSGVFSLSDAETVPPTSVLEEVAYFASGGDIGCMDDGKVDVQYLPPFTVEPHQRIPIITCGWGEGENVEVTIQHSARNEETINVIATQYPIDAVPSAILWFDNLESGEHTFIFKGEKETVSVTLPIVKPDEARMYSSSSDSTLYLYGLIPQERVAVYAYKYGEQNLIEFVAWDEYIADEKGNLLISLAEDPLLYFSVGENSGFLQDGNSILIIDGTILQ